MIGQCLAFLAEDGDRLADRHDLALGGDLFEQHAFVGRRHFDRHLIRHDFDQRLILLDVVAFFDEPLDDLALDDRLGQLGHLVFYGHLVSVE